MKKYYCIGIKGAGMSTLAQILSDIGNEVSGYDDDKKPKYTEQGLKKRNIKIYYDHDHELDPDTIVTYSKAFHEDHQELQRVRKLGLMIVKYNEIIGELVQQFSTIAVSGTHGKTTTCSLISHILTNTIGCNYFIGAGDGYADKNNNCFVLEADEYNRHFLAYQPDYAVITNIELDHTECYKDLDDLKKAFEEFASGVKKKVIACGDSKTVRSIKYNQEVLFYGFNTDNDLTAKNIVLNETGSSFDVYYQKEFLAHFKIPLYGEHNILNTLAAIAICLQYKISIENIYAYLKTFHNAKKRFSIEEVCGCTFLDDYAHHPTEITVTLQAVRQKFPNKRIVAVFLPNTYSRTLALRDDFVKALSSADKVFVTAIHSDRELQEEYPNVSSDLIIKEIPDAELISEETISKLDNEMDSIVCFMGCASTTAIRTAYRNRIKEVKGE